MNSIELWRETERVLKDMYGKRLTDGEFQAFLLVARKLGLDPVSREIIPQVREGQQGRQVVFIVSRDGYLKSAMRDPGFAGLQSMVVREGDIFEIHPSEGRVVHRFGSKRGEILGAWAIAYHKERPSVIFFADFKEYYEANKASPTWRSYPSAMIQKVAEVGALRRQFPLSGVVAAEEIGVEPPPVHDITTQIPGVVPEPRLPSPHLPTPITPEQVRALSNIFSSLGLKGEPARELAQRWVERDLTSVKDLTQDEAEDLLAYLKNLAELLEPLGAEERGQLLTTWLRKHSVGVPTLNDLIQEEEGIQGQLGSVEVEVEDGSELEEPWKEPWEEPWEEPPGDIEDDYEVGMWPEEDARR
jgi:phage recombination protein Bet